MGIVPDWLEQKAKEAEEKSKSQTSLQKAEVIQLPLWAEEKCGMPNGFLRSALFGAIRRGSRRYLQQEKVVSLDGIELIYTGQRLDQGDFDVWGAALQFARQQNLGEECRFTAYSMLKVLDKTDTGGNRKVLDNRLTRLKATAVRIKSGRYSYEGSLLDAIYRDEDTREYITVLNPKMHVLFAADQFTQLDWNIRQALNGKPLAQWLHGFFASHAKPLPISIDKLHKLSGSESTELWKFTQTLRKSLDQLVSTYQQHRLSFSYEITDNLVHVSKTPSKSQRFHLAKKARKKRKSST
ncbi:MAG: hypothetical protein CSA11_12070 [Chloroflexi bacterium]|nr:MAG: hypothetical protein CSA11_12070 [Chloroflexota bacterium]